MPIAICPRCIQRYTYSNHCGDYVHECNSGNPTLDQEDVTVTGRDFIEFGQSGTMGPININLQATQNKLQGTFADIEGERFQGVTPRGANIATHRQRQYYEYIDNMESNDKRPKD